MGERTGCEDSNAGCGAMPTEGGESREHLRLSYLGLNFDPGFKCKKNTFNHRD